MGHGHLVLNKKLRMFTVKINMERLPATSNAAAWCNKDVVGHKNCSVLNDQPGLVIRGSYT